MKRRDAMKLILGGVGGLCTGSFAPGAQQNDLPMLTGWIDDSTIRDKFIQRHRRPFLSQHNSQIKGTGAGKKAFLWKLFEQVTGGPLMPHTQTVGDCFIAGTLVTMSDGSQRAIETVEIGEFVLSHRGVSCKVTRIIRKPYRKSLVKFQAHGRLEKITCTPDHLILVNDSEWKAAGTLKLTDRLHLPRYVVSQGGKIYDLLDVCPDAETKGKKLRAKGSPQWVNRYIKLDKKLASVIGAYLAEGGCSKSKAGQWCRVDFNLNYREDDFAEQIAKNMRQIFGIACTVTSVPSKPTVQYVRCDNTAVARFFKYLVPGNTYTKKVPLDFLTAPVKVQLACLLNWLEGDGSCHGRKNCKLRTNHRPQCSGVSVSRDLINGLFQLAANCNLTPKIRMPKAQANRAQAYVIQFNTVDTSRLYFKAPWPEKAISFTVSLKKISSISKVATTVYCLEVAEDHSFIANGYAVHNCIGHTFGLGIDALTAVRMAMYQMPERWVAKTATEIIYAGARIEAGGMSRKRLMKDGATGTLAADFCRDYGVLLRQSYLEGQHDFTRYSGAKARAMGRRGRGVPNELEPLCKLHPLKTCSLVRSWEECRDAIANGYPVAMCSNLGFWTKRDKDGFLRRRRKPWYHAMILLGVDDEYRRPGALAVNSWGCFDEQTELLTDGGWKFFSELEGAEKIATLNQETHELEYQFPTCYHRYPYDGHLWHHRSRDIDFAVTPNHNLYVTKQRGAGEWFLQRADECIQTIKMKKNAHNPRPDQDSYKIGELEISMDLWLEFLGYYLSEGYATETQSYFQGTKNGVTRKVGICQLKETNRRRIEACLVKMPFEFHVQTREFCNYIDRSLLNELKPLGKAHEKYLPDYVWKCSARQLKILYDALMLGDGSISPSPTGWKRTYYTSSKRLADDFQRLLLHCGYAGDISWVDRRGRDNGTGGITRYIEYRIGIKVKALEQHATYKPILLPYKGEVFCVTVPNQVIYVRRSGRAVWMGNSSWVSGPTRHNQPAGSFWIDAATVDAAMKQEDSLALSGYVGYPQVDLPSYILW